MARDGSGTYSLPATMATSGATASSTTVNSIMDDVAQALTDSVNKDGSKAFAANQSMGGNKITSLGAATALTDAAQLSQVQNGTASQASTVGGTVDAITLAFSPAITSYASNMRIRWRSGGANTVTTPTLNIDSLGAKTIKKNPGGAALAVGDLGTAGTINEAVYNGTDFILLSAIAAVDATTSVRGLVELATAAEFRNNTADRALDTTGAWSAADTVALTWTSGGTTAVDLNAGFNFTVTTATGNSTLGAPTNAKTGQSGFIYITQDASTPRTLAFASAWVFAGGTDPTLTATASAKDILFYQVISSTGPIVYATLVKNVS